MIWKSCTVCFERLERSSCIQRCFPLGSQAVSNRCYTIHWFICFSASLALGSTFFPNACKPVTDQTTSPLNHLIRQISTLSNSKGSIFFFDHSALVFVEGHGLILGNGNTNKDLKCTMEAEGALRDSTLEGGKFAKKISPGVIYPQQLG